MLKVGLELWKYVVQARTIKGSMQLSKAKIEKNSRKGGEVALKSELSPIRVFTVSYINSLAMFDVAIWRRFYISCFIDGGPFGEICYEYEIRPNMAKHLRRLESLKIVFIIDDSGSMKTPIRDEPRTRWAKSCEIVKTLLKFCLIFHPEGVDIQFINGRRFSKVKEHTVVDQIYEKPPTGYTPLVPILEKINQEHKSHDPNIQLLLFIVTGGQPTDKYGNSDVSAFDNLLKMCSKDRICVSFIICTDDRQCVAYLDKWDTTMANITVTDDFCIERAKLYERLNQHNYSFTLGDYLVRMLVGATIPDILGW